MGVRRGEKSASGPQAGSRWFRFNLWLHRWSSLIATLPFLVLCVTGSILIFHDEIDAALGAVPVRTAPSQARISDCVATLVRDFPDQRILSLGLDPEGHPGILLGVVGPPADTGFDNAKLVYLDLATGKTLGDSDPSKTVTGFLLELHAEWFLGPVGRLLGGLIGLLVVASLLSGLVIYGPFMKKVLFGSVRRARGARLTQLDLHNLIGAVTLGWGIAVSATGVLLGFGQVAQGIWQYTDLARLRDEYARAEAVDVRAVPAPAGDVLTTVERAAKPGWHVVSVIFPGTDFTTKRHYGVLTMGSEGLDSKLIHATLVDGASGEIVREMDMPAYLQAIFVSEPLHFGDYGGLPLKLLWTVCNLLTLFITANGLWLFFDKRRTRSLASATEPANQSASSPPTAAETSP